MVIYDDPGGKGCMVYWGLTPQQQPGSYQGGEMMMKSVFWWRKPEYPEETTDLRQVADGWVTGWWERGFWFEFGFDLRFYALSASKAIFRARTYTHIYN